MSLPVYQHFHIRTPSLDEIEALLRTDMNVKHPVVFHLSSLHLEDQREVAGLIENFFDSNNISFKFPYPVYLITDHEKSITNIPVVSAQSQLPKFFSQKESRMNVKETHLAGKNKLLHQEIRNNDPSVSLMEIEAFGKSHREIYELEREGLFYRSILNKLTKVKKRG